VGKVLEGSGISPELLGWIGGVLGGEVTGCERIPGGASRLSFKLKLAQPSQVAEAFLRVDSGAGPLSGTLFTLEREIAAMRSLRGTGVRLPQIYAFNAEHRAVLMQNVAGGSDIFSVSDPVRVDLQNDLLAQLALLHKAPTDLREAFGPSTPSTVKDALESEVSLWGSLYRQHVPGPEPAITFALDWLRRSAPGGNQTPVLVHGDIGPGNFLFENSSVRALIDWEIAHAGHPLEDLACIIARSLGVPFGDLRKHVATYGNLVGREVDYGELDYCVVLVLTRYCIGIAMGISKPSLAVDLPVLVKFLQVNLLALVRIIARLSGVRAVDVESTPAQPTFTTTYYDFVTAVLTSQIKPVVDERYLLARLDGVSALLAYLRNVSDYGPDRLRAEELTALRRILGSELATVEEGRDALSDALEKSSAEERVQMLAWLMKRLGQQHWLMKEMLGPMYERSLEY
jgi:aminoglycoside phosphotransferase (APT) family kinase protein